MNLFQEYLQAQSRRYFLSQGKNVLGGAALAGLLGRSMGAETDGPGAVKTHFAPKAKRVIYLHMVGGPAQMDLFDYKPALGKWYDKDLPDSVRKGQRLTTMTSGQKRFPIAPSKYQFAQKGQCGMWMNDELLPNLHQCADDICWMRSLHTEAINHEPAIAAMQTGNQITGRPCLGAWASYGLGSTNENLPAFVVMVATPSNREQEQAISSRLWSSGYLSGEHAGVSFRSKGDPILYINNPAGVPDAIRQRTIKGINEMNELTYKELGDPETFTRIKQYEMAARMQASMPELTDLSKEPEHTFELYGEEARKPGSFANVALMARRLAERDVRFIQVYHNNWDHHGNVNGRMPSQCRDVDRPCYALINDLKERGMFDDTLIIWGGEFGRTIYSQGGLSKTNYGRDHHPRCFTMWMAGGGTKGGSIYGETDDFSYNITKDPLHIRDFHATILHLLGYDHERFTVKYQGLNQRLTGVEQAKVVKELLA
ncbi:MAG: sulfatase [Roseibacillus sp.]|nr:sulfatase [Roseibacillus sp.]|tara:strand:- start:10520 stop:11971 length:1452 start_codon:yes stop_codon:yes gene_type:complete